MDNYLSSKRDSNIELFRILTMLAIVGHHYVVHSGLKPIILESFPSASSIFLLLFGFGGKIGINCFVLITGYFMCTSQITLRKFLKLFFSFYLYKVFFALFFILIGYVNVSFDFIAKSLVPINTIKDDFVSCYLVFFCFIPFLNILINGMTKKQHQILLIPCLLVFSIFPMFSIKVSYSYVSWFMVIYLIGSYLRLYQPRWSLNRGYVTAFFSISLLCSLASVIVGACLFNITGKNLIYFFVVDSNKPLAVLTAVFAFLFFKNLKIGYSKVINTVAASTFGVLLIHDNSDIMRNWLWNDQLNCVGHLSNNIYFFAFASVLLVYSICTLIDFLRIQLLEKNFFKWFDSKSNLSKGLHH